MMSIISRVFRRSAEKQGSVDDPHFWESLFSLSAKSKSGQAVTPDSALRNTAVFACVRVLAETIASLPLMIYARNKSGGKDIAADHPLYTVLHDAPNPEQSSFEFIEMLTGHTALRGNAYSFIEWTNGSDVLALYPLNPARMSVRRVNGVLRYEYTHPDGMREIFPADHIWHWKGLSSDGLEGLSPIALARESIGLALAAEDYGARFFENDSSPRGILEYPGKLQEDQTKRLREQWQEMQTGANRHKVAIIQGGLKWSQIGLSHEDAQFIETRNFQIEDIARIFRVPAILIQHPDKSSTYASAEQFMLSFVVHTIRPWCVRIERSANLSLLSAKDRKKYFIEFKLDGLLRGDIQSRYTAYQIACGGNAPWMSRNEVRALENLNPIAGLDDLLQPLNMRVVGGNGDNGDNGGVIDATAA